MIKTQEEFTKAVYETTKDDDIVNLENYYANNGAFEDNGWDLFLVVLNRLMTIDEFFQYLDIIIIGAGANLPDNSEGYNDIALYPIDDNGYAEIPTGTSRIKEESFINCSKLVSVTFPDTMCEIGGFAFGGCSNLASIDIPSSVRVIGPSAFNGCKSLASVVIKSHVCLVIEERAFARCVSHSDVASPNAPTTLYMRRRF